MYGMNTDSWAAWCDYIVKIQHQVQLHQTQISQLEAQIARLSDRLTAADAKPGYHIDKLEYHFDQLKVEKLEGTLNIGMAPPPADQTQDVGQWSIPAPTAPFAQGAEQASKGTPNEQTDASFGRIQEEVNRYLDDNGLSDIERIETESGIQLDAYHRKIILTDLKKQLAPRISYYMNAAQPADAGGQTAEQSGAQVIANTINDLETAMRNYIAQLKG